jgi:hypothetical protein
MKKKAFLHGGNGDGTLLVENCMVMIQNTTTELIGIALFKI